MTDSFFDSLLMIIRDFWQTCGTVVLYSGRFGTLTIQNMLFGFLVFGIILTFFVPWEYTHDGDNEED